MKEKIFSFIIGVLVGAIIATGGFIIYQKTHKGNAQQGMNRGERPQMMQQRDGSTNSSSENSNVNDQNSQGTPPALPNGEQPSGEAPTGNAPTGNAPTTQTNNSTENNA